LPRRRRSPQGAFEVRRQEEGRREGRQEVISGSGAVAWAFSHSIKLGR
jgi:hypothetical protein